MNRGWRRPDQINEVTPAIDSSKGGFGQPLKGSVRLLQHREQSLAWFEPGQAQLPVGIPEQVNVASCQQARIELHASHVFVSKQRIGSNDKKRMGTGFGLVNYTYNISHDFRRAIDAGGNTEFALPPDLVKQRFPLLGQIRFGRMKSAIDLFGVRISRPKTLAVATAVALPEQIFLSLPK